MTVGRLRIVLFVAAISGLLLLAQPAAAHCDTMEGPVVKDAQLAFKTGDVTPVLKWISKADESQIRAAFEQAQKVRTLSPEASDLAEHYFFETLVRVHRAGEGVAYTGLKPAGTEVDPGIEMADRALETGSINKLLNQVTSEVAAGIRQRFAHVQETSAHAKENVEAGRRYVAAYVGFIHYIERIHQSVSGPVSHGDQQSQVAETASH